MVLKPYTERLKMQLVTPNMDLEPRAEELARPILSSGELVKALQALRNVYNELKGNQGPDVPAVVYGEPRNAQPIVDNEVFIDHACPVPMRLRVDKTRFTVSIPSQTESEASVEILITPKENL